MNCIKECHFNGGNIFYNFPLFAELILLTMGPKKAHKEIKKLVSIGFPKEIFDIPFVVPVDENERYERALNLINVIGRAVGKELAEVNHNGDMEHLYRIFREGMLSGFKRNVNGSTIERIFYEAGCASGHTVFNIRKVDTKEILDNIMLDARTAFEGGIEKWAV